jgi:uncharacterized protein YbcI
MDPASSKRQQLMDEIVHAEIRFLKERMGRDPEGYRTYVMDDMIVLRLLRVLTPAENQQATTAEGQGSTKATRMRLIHDIRPSLENLISRLTGANVISVHSDLSTKTGEAIMIVVLDRKIAHRARGPWPTRREPRVPQPYAYL